MQEKNQSNDNFHIKKNGVKDKLYKCDQCNSTFAMKIKVPLTQMKAIGNVTFVNVY